MKAIESRSLYAVRRQFGGNSETQEEIGANEVITQKKRLAKNWDSDVILEITKVPAYIGEEIAEIMLDIGTMIRFFKMAGLESYVKPASPPVAEIA